MDGTSSLNQEEGEVFQDTPRGSRSAASTDNRARLSQVNNSTSLTTLAGNLNLQEPQPGPSSSALSPQQQRDRKRARFYSSDNVADSLGLTDTAFTNRNASDAARINTESSASASNRTDAIPDTQTLNNFRVTGNAELIWKQARNNFIQAEKASIRSQRFNNWATLGLIPNWAIGTSSIPPHLLTDQSQKNQLSTLIFEQGRELILEIAKNLEIQSKHKLSQAQALLRTVKDIYGDNTQNYHLATIKLKNFVDRQMIFVKKNLDHQEARLRADAISATTAINYRCPPVEPKPTPQKRKGRSPSRGPTRNQRQPSRNRSREIQSPSPKRRRSTSRNNRRNRSPDRQTRIVLTKFLQDLIKPNPKR